MTSDTSSAMLDLNDADTEDTEPPSITDDGRDGIPLIMEHGYDIAVKVDAPMKQLSTLETFVTYRVRCVCARWPTPPAVRRRYNHFKLLHKRLAAATWVAAPPLPALHTARQQLDRYAPAFVAVRTTALNAFLDRVAKHPIFSHSEDFRLFITTPDEEFDKVFKSESSALNLWGFGSALYGGDTRPVHNGARVRDPEWSSASEYLTSLQAKLTALASLTDKLYKGGVAVATEMMNMKRACDVWASQSRGATARAVASVAAGAAPRAPRAPPAPRALLPLLAAYTGAHVDKIRQRDQLHAAYVSGANATGEMHNKLEQCTEALRSELADWLPKTRGEIKSILLELADSQVALHSQIYRNWEHALRLSTDANAEEIFKTVSKNAVQNLSPSRCRSELTPTETEGDFDLENDSNDSDESRTNERVNGKNGNEWVEVDVSGSFKNGAVLNVENVIEAQGTEKFLNEILDDTASGSREVKDSISLSAKSDAVSDVVSDPLKEFSDVDLS